MATTTMRNTKIHIILVLFIFFSTFSQAQKFSGFVIDSETNSALANVEVRLVEDDLSTTTDAAGKFEFTAPSLSDRVISAELEGYVFYKELIPAAGANDFKILLRPRKKSIAAIRLEGYKARESETLSYERQQEWTSSFEKSRLSGDFAPDRSVTRRDPSAVLEIDGTYYTWYTRGTGPVPGFNTGDPEAKIFPWDKCDIWYGTSTDGYTWKEEGPAVLRGPKGTFDDRSVFTPEIFAHDGKYYLVYQAVKAPYVVRVKNTVAMAVADNPRGPWRKLDEPILRPTDNGIWRGDVDNRFLVHKKGDFDSHKVHDPTLIYFKGKFMLYYKGEQMGEERFLGQREIKWGVAIADNPEGPYIKSEYNPITNTGHELTLWKYNGGIALIHTLDGPERNTIQFSEDGINFKIMSSATQLPHAFGLFRDEESSTNPLQGIQWGLAHELVWDRPGGWMYLHRFDLLEVQATDIFFLLETINLNVGKTRRVLPEFVPSNSNKFELEWESDAPSIVEVDENGVLNGKRIGSATIRVKLKSLNISRELDINVISGDIEEKEISIEAEEFEKTGNLSGETYGGPLGVGRAATVINFVNKEDWATYTVDVPFSGNYTVNYLISTPLTDNIKIQLKQGDEVLNEESVANSGDWNSFYNLIGKNSFFLKKGVTELTIFASGENDWQWNLDRFVLRAEVITGIDEVEKESSIVFYPNPAKTQLSFNKTLSLGTTLTITDFTGKVKREETITSNQFDSIDISTLDKGYYLLEINTPKMTTVKRFIKY